MRRDVMERFVEALGQVEEALREVTDGGSLAWALRELEEWLADMTREMQERRLRSPELHRLLEGRCAEVRVPGPDARGPFCLVLVGLRDEDFEHVAGILGDGYQVQEYLVEGETWVSGPAYWHLGSVLEGLQNQYVYIAEVAS